jgi:hypothetical protein
LQLRRHVIGECRNSVHEALGIGDGETTAMAVELM